MTLDQIGVKSGTDKSSVKHNYLPVYERYFEKLKHDPVVLLELGIGGYKHVNRGGESLRMWYEYFPVGKIYGIDNYSKEGISNDRIKTFVCSQEDQGRLNWVIEQIGNPDIIIDDASHVNSLSIKSFDILFPLLKPGGIYVVEDIESSWAVGWAEGCMDYQDYHFPTTINYFRQMTDRINAQYIPHYPHGESEVRSIHFYKNIIFILKK